MRHHGFALHNVLGAGLNRPLSPVEVELNVRALSGKSPCLRTDGASAPLPCSKNKGHDGPCYHYRP